MPMQTVVGSQLPLVILPMHEDIIEYNPFEHRKLDHPTTYVSHQIDRILVTSDIIAVNRTESMNADRISFPFKVE